MHSWFADHPKAELGLLRGPLDLGADMAVEILFVMAGYNKESQAIANEVSKMQESQASKKRRRFLRKFASPQKENR